MTCHVMCCRHICRLSHDMSCDVIIQYNHNITMCGYGRLCMHVAAYISILIEPVVDGVRTIIK